MLEDLLNAYLIKLLFQCSPSKFSDVLFYSFTAIYGSDWLIKFLFAE
jgi:hypothetical protein